MLIDKKQEILSVGKKEIDNYKSVQIILLLFCIDLGELNLQTVVEKTDCKIV